MKSKILSRRALPIRTLTGFVFFIGLLILMPILVWAFTVSPNPYQAGSLQLLALSCDSLDFNGNPRNIAVYFSNNNENEMDFYTTDCTDTGIGIYLDNNYTGPLPVTVHIMQQNEQSCAGFTAQSCFLSRSAGTEFLLNYTNASSPTPTPTPPVSPPVSGGSQGSIQQDTGTINVVKKVINDNGRTKVVADFQLFVNGMRVTSGVTNTFPAPAGVYTVAETSDNNYTKTFSGDCDMNGQLNLNRGENKFCIITNNDTVIPAAAPIVVPPVPPLIDLVKVPSPLSLPNGPGPVTYTYTLRNVGTVPVTDITMVGDTCSPIVLVSGDSNNDSILGVRETWTYRCTTTLSETHTNTITATGQANGISATDIASATVIVGVPVAVPPLIHVVQIPNPLTLLAGGGMVTYTAIVSNPGAIVLGNIKLTNDNCSSVKYISGDMNRDSKLNISELWTYTCQTNITKITTNTATASGEVAGVTVRDLAITTVVVAIPNVPIVADLPDLPDLPNLPNLPNPALAQTTDTTAPSSGMLLFVLVPIVLVVGIIVYYFFTRRKDT